MKRRELERRRKTYGICTNRKPGYWPIETSDVFPSETMMLQTMNFNRWSDFVCDAPHIMEQEVARSKVLWNMRRRCRQPRSRLFRKLLVLKDHRGDGHNGLNAGTQVLFF